MDEFQLIDKLALKLGIAGPESQEERNLSVAYKRQVLRKSISYMIDLEAMLDESKGWEQACKNESRDRSKLQKLAVDYSAQVEELKSKLTQSEKDKAFYKCCALSGEIPQEGSEPSALHPSPDSITDTGDSL